MPPLNQFKRFDVRDLLRRGIEPFPEIRKRVDTLKPDQGLVVIAPFLPSPLVEMLGSEGFQAKVERGKNGEWIITFGGKLPESVVVISGKSPLLGSKLRKRHGD
jgi:hypothetical protein